jgi:hypothetical protein
MRTDPLSSGFCAAAVCCVGMAILNLPGRADAQYQGKPTGQPKPEAIQPSPAQRTSPQAPCTEVKTQGVRRDGGNRAVATKSDPLVFRVVGRPPPPTGSSGESGKTDVKQNEAARAAGTAAKPDAASAAKGDPKQDKVAALAPGTDKRSNAVPAKPDRSQPVPCE